VLDSGYTDHMTWERSMFTFFEKNDCPSDCITFGYVRSSKTISHYQMSTNHVFFMGFSYLDSKHSSLDLTTIPSLFS
jgi:hypothetical protein